MSKENEKLIWSKLMEEIGNPYGVAALMGNLMAESSLNPLCKTGGDKAINGKEYVMLVDKCLMHKDEFANDGVAFGLAQWCFWTRKADLYDLWGVMPAGTSIGSLDVQLNYLLIELPESYKSVWQVLKNATNIGEASDIVMLKYEKPANTGESAKNKRRKYAKEFFDKYAEIDPPSPEPKPKEKIVRTTMDRVFIRHGNGTEYTAYTRIEKKGTAFKWVATSDNGWNAVEFSIGKTKYVGWMSGECTVIEE